MSDHEILEIARAIRYDLTAMQGKLSELIRMAGKLEPESTDGRSCPECGMLAVSLPGGTSLADHRWQSHGIEVAA